MAASGTRPAATMYLQGGRSKGLPIHDNVRDGSVYSQFVGLLMFCSNAGIKCTLSLLTPNSSPILSHISYCVYNNRNRCCNIAVSFTSSLSSGKRYPHKLNIHPSTAAFIRCGCPPHLSVIFLFSNFTSSYNLIHCITTACTTSSVTA